MSLSETSVEHLAIAIADSNPWERMAYFLPLMRLLSRGDPVTREQLATVLGRPEARVAEALRQFEDVVYDEEGRIVGAGLSLPPTPYRFEVQGHDREIEEQSTEHASGWPAHPQGCDTRKQPQAIGADDKYLREGNNHGPFITI